MTIFNTISFKSFNYESYKETALHLAVKNGNFDIVKLLLDSEDIDEKIKDSIHFLI